MYKLVLFVILLTTGGGAYAAPPSFEVVPHSVCGEAAQYSFFQLKMQNHSVRQGGDMLKVSNVGGVSTIDVIAGKAERGMSKFAMNFIAEGAGYRYLLPIGAGAAIRPGNKMIRLAWPNTWSSAFMVLEMAPECVVAIWSDDSDYPYKDLVLEGHQFSIQILRPVAAQAKSRWFIKTFSNWRKAADAFRDGVLKPARQKPSDLANKIDQVVLQRLNKNGFGLHEKLHELAGRYDPARTLLYWPLWRESDFDENYPDYTPKPFIKDAIAQAHKLGFRVMLHFNTDFVGMNFRYKERLWGDRLLRWGPDGCKEPIFYRHPKFSVRDSFKVDRGSLVWKEVMFAAISEQYAVLHFDAIHLDVSVSILASCNAGGIAGTRRFLRELHEDFPGLVISGEENSEITYEWLDLYQALPANISGWPVQLRDLAESHPIGLYIYAPAKVYAHLHGRKVDPDGAIYQAFGQKVAEQDGQELQRLLLPTYWE